VCCTVATGFASQARHAKPRHLLRRRAVAAAGRRECDTPTRAPPRGRAGRAGRQARGRRASSGDGPASGRPGWTRPRRAAHAPDPCWLPPIPRPPSSSRARARRGKGWCQRKAAAPHAEPNPTAASARPAGRRPARGGASARCHARRGRRQHGPVPFRVVYWRWHPRFLRCGRGWPGPARGGRPVAVMSGRPGGHPAVPLRAGAPSCAPRCLSMPCVSSKAARPSHHRWRPDRPVGQARRQALRSTPPRLPLGGGQQAGE